jgi:CubicO group peptidase (beta-lactamase class C family)
LLIKTNSILVVVFISQFIVLSNCSNSQAPINSSDLTEKIDTYLTESASNGYSGAVVVAKQGNIILSKGYGWSDRSKKIPITSSTIFNIGSVSKQFTAAAILKLMEQGKLKTSDRIGDFFKAAPPDKKDITIHQLLTHTSGISARTGGFRYDAADKEQILSECFESDLQSNPGSKHEYANANYIILAAILESVSKQSYHDFLHSNLWLPSNMLHTSYDSITTSDAIFAHGYYYNFTDGIWTDWGITQDHLPDKGKHWYSIGKGDILSSIEDLYKWHLALEGNRVLSANTRKIQETPYVTENEEGTSHYAYGWAIFSSIRGTKIVAHNGSNGIYFADFIRFVDEDVVIITLSNRIMGKDSENVAWEVSNLVFDSNYEPKPIAKFSYEIVHDFMKSYKPSDAKMLPSVLEKELGHKFEDHSVLNRIGYSNLKNEREPGWALELLKLNAQLFPKKDGNIWDSLGEAYLSYGLIAEAEKSFETALELKSENCHWCENSLKRLNEISSKKK